MAVFHLMACMSINAFAARLAREAQLREEAENVSTLVGDAPSSAAIASRHPLQNLPLPVPLPMPTTPPIIPDKDLRCAPPSISGVCYT